MVPLNIATSICVLILACAQLAQSSSSGCELLDTIPESSQQVIKYGNNSEITFDGYIQVAVGPTKALKYVALTNGVAKRSTWYLGKLTMHIEFDCANLMVYSSDLVYVTFAYDYVKTGVESAICVGTPKVYLKPDGSYTPSPDQQTILRCLDIYEEKSKLALRYVKLADNDHKPPQ